MQIVGRSPRMVYKISEAYSRTSKLFRVFSWSMTSLTRPSEHRVSGLSRLRRWLELFQYELQVSVPEVVSDLIRDGADEASAGVGCGNGGVGLVDCKARFDDRLFGAALPSLVPPRLNTPRLER